MVDPKSLDFRLVLPNSASKFFNDKDVCIQERLGSFQVYLKYKETRFTIKLQFVLVKVG